MVFCFAFVVLQSRHIYRLFVFLPNWMISCATAMNRLNKNNACVVISFLAHYYYYFLFTLNIFSVSHSFIRRLTIWSGSFDGRENSWTHRAGISESNYTRRHCTVCPFFNSSFTFFFIFNFFYLVITAGPKMKFCKSCCRLRLAALSNQWNTIPLHVFITKTPKLRWSNKCRPLHRINSQRLPS